MTKVRNAFFVVLISACLIAISGCGSNHTAQQVVPSTTADSHAKQAQIFVTNPTPPCDADVCWIIPCDACFAAIPMLMEAYYVGGGGTAPPPPPADPVDQISIPNDSSTGQVPSAGTPVQCVTLTGAFTTGCGGIPGDSGQGIGVFYDSNSTCYWNFQSLARICFAAKNRPPILSPGDDLTTTYCYDRKGLKTQHWFNVPNLDSGSETFDTYIGIDGVIAASFTLISPHQTLGLVVWGVPPRFPAVPNSTSHIQLYANESIPGVPFIKVPVKVGFARRTETDSFCTQSF